MDAEPGDGWADAVSRILRMGKNNPESNQILSKAKKEDHSDNSQSEASDGEDGDSTKSVKISSDYRTLRLKPQAQPDAMTDKELNAIATRGVVHLFNAVKTVNPKSDKKRKKKKKRKKGLKKRTRR